MADRRSALPARRGRLIGRDRELVDLRNRVLHGDRRLLTLTGAGGAGKTALALEAARQLEPAMPDGVWLVDLSAIREPDAVALTMSDALGIVDQERPPVEALADHLAARQTLIVLDNCEHLLPGMAPTVDALLDASPDLRIIATSRTPLRISGESVFVVPPFAVPDVGGATDLGRLASVPAVELFVERASAADPSFALSPTTAPAIAAICRRLDGLPLAIELAAAQAAVLTPIEIDERLGSLGGLSAVSRRGPARQRTMDATLDWSHDLLEPVEQAVFRRLAVFAGGWTLEAAEQVCSLGDDPERVVVALATLVDHSLVVRDGDGPRSRYRMLTPIAEYATRRLAEADEAGAAGMAHGMYFFALTSDYDQGGAALPEALDAVAAEHENCLAAIRFAEQSGATPLWLGLLRNHQLFWRVRGHIRLGVRHFESALDAVADGTYARGLLLGVLAEYQQVLGEYDVAEGRAREAEALFASMGDQPVAQRIVIGVLGLIAAARGDFVQAIAEYRRARPLVDALPSDISLAYWHAGVGRFELGLGDLPAAERDLELAREHFGRAPSWGSAQVLAQLGVIARRNGDAARAEALLAESLDLLRRYGATIEAIACLEDVARVAARAASVASSRNDVRRDDRAPRHDRSDAESRDRALLDSDIDRVRSMLDARVFDEAWSLGLGLTLDEAVDVATSPSDKVVAARPVPRGSALTPREREIADLVALGMTNREIAERLVISPGTVRIHVERILGKLGRTSRVQVATWVVDQRDRAGAVGTSSD